MNSLNIAYKVMSMLGKKVWKTLQKDTQNPKAAQEQLLFSILHACENSDFGKKNNLSSIKTVEDFQKALPICTYNDIEPYVEKIWNGEQNILIDEKIVHISSSSGTSGKVKKIPVSQSFLSDYSKYFALYLGAFLPDKEFGSKWMSGTCLSLIVGTNETLDCGITFGSGTSASAQRTSQGYMKKMYSTPSVIRYPQEEFTPTYFHARFALENPNITFCSITFSSYLLSLFRYIEGNWKMLLKDIETGTIDGSVDFPDSIREEVESQIDKNPVRAKELEAIFSKGFTDGVFSKVWPRLRFVTTVGNDNFKVYTDILKEKYLDKNVDYLMNGLSASEGLISIPVEKNAPDSVLIPNSCFLEFQDVGTSEIFTMDKIEKGKQYKVIVTNKSGVFRYDLNDIVEVTGFFNKTPKIKFIDRSDKTLNIAAEKTSESALNTAIAKACSSCDLEFVDYSVAGNYDTQELHYDVMIELVDEIDQDTFERLKKCVREEIGRANPIYDEWKRAGKIYDAELFILKPNTYADYRSHVTRSSGILSLQVKPPHIIDKPDQLDFFKKHIII